MKLAEALKVLRMPVIKGSDCFSVFLACGFTPLHLQTFLTACLRVAQPGRRVEVHSGIYGDLSANLDRMNEALPNAGGLVIEWPDLDPRLGLRQLGGWRPSQLPDILETAKAQVARIESAIGEVSGKLPLAVSLPTLPLPPIAYTQSGQTSSFEAQLRECISAWAGRLTEQANVTLVNHLRLGRLSDSSNRHDVKSELVSGFPYTLSHASAIAELLAACLEPPQSKKGLIVDLDDTVWRGTLGEDGVHGISWDLDRRSQMHGVFQQFLGSLAEMGVLIGVASKNDSALVEEAFLRDDLIVSKDCLFPIEAHWGPKSDSVDRILRAWNVGADSVVFLDNSPMELAEVKESFPEVECIQYPAGNDQAVYELIYKLRDIFGKDSLSEEDSIRSASIRSANSPERESELVGQGLDAFLKGAEAEVSFGFAKNCLDPRALELVNKTNQFNLNGRRFNNAQWCTYLENPNSFLLVVAYRDKYGPLGKVAILTGKAEGETLFLDTWVMSCRAFTRRLEHKCLDLLFQKFQIEEIELDFLETPRNQPMQEFISDFREGSLGTQIRFTKGGFLEKCPRLYHSATELSDG